MAVLDGEALTTFLALSVRGYTIRRLRQHMKHAGHDLAGVPDAALIQLQLDHGTEISEGRKDADRSTLDKYGLASQMERVRRMCEAAEAIEPLIAKSPKWSGEYRRFLAQIQAELEPLNIEISPSDKWADLLMRLADVDQSDPTAEKAAD